MAPFCMAAALYLAAAPFGWYANTADPSDRRLLVVGAFGARRWVSFSERTIGTLKDKTLVIGQEEATITTGAGSIHVGGPKPRHYVLDKSPPYDVRDVTIPANGISISATIYEPRGLKSYNAVVVIHGSGESHRDNLWYLEHADYLARNGIAVLLPDKRGCGRTTGDWKLAGFDVLAEDALIARRHMQEQKRVRRVGMLGLSQGGWIGVHAARLEPRASFVVTVSCSATTPGEQIRHETRNDFVNAGLSGSLLEGAMNLQKLAEDYVRTDNWEAYISGLESAKGTPLALVAARFPKDPDAWMWEWTRRIVDYDPLLDLSSRPFPALFVYGRLDEKDNVPVAQSVSLLDALRGKGRKDLTVKAFEGTGHALFDVENNQIRRDYLQLVADWINKM